MSLKFGYWAPILSGGYVLSNIPQRTEWSISANIRLAQTAERVGFDYTLLPARFTSLECGDGQNDALATSAYLAAATERLKIIGAFHTAYWHPAMIAKSDRQAAAEVSVKVQEAFACGYETATETRKAQEQAIASVEQSSS